MSELIDREATVKQICKIGEMFGMCRDRDVTIAIALYVQDDKSTFPTITIPVAELDTTTEFEVKNMNKRKMSINEAIDIIKAECECVYRQGKTGECCRDDMGCGACDLVRKDVDIITAYEMAIDALHARLKLQDNYVLTRIDELENRINYLEFLHGKEEGN